MRSRPRLALTLAAVLLGFGLTAAPALAAVVQGVTATYNMSTRQATVNWDAPSSGSVSLTRTDSTGSRGSTTQPASLGTYRFGSISADATWVEVTVGQGVEKHAVRLSTTTRQVIDQVSASFDSATRRPTITWATPTTGDVTLTRTDSTGGAVSTTQAASAGSYQFGTVPALATWVEVSIEIGEEKQVVRMVAESAPDRLSWAPPVGWENFPVRNVTSRTGLTTINAGGGNVRIVLPTTYAAGPITITNCNNAVLIGGAIRVLPVTQINGIDQRGIFVNSCTGTVHIEGVFIDGNVDGAEADGIAVSAPSAVVQVENVRVTNLRGGQSTNHADVFQPWGGVREYRIDRLTGTTNYQGFKPVPAFDRSIGRGIVRNANVGSSEQGPTDGGGYYWWAQGDHPVTLDNFWLKPRANRTLGTSVWPPSNAGADSCPAVVTNNQASWPDWCSGGILDGVVNGGSPPAGDFVAAGNAGLGYASPGYL